ncbi:unnamed protein product [Hermetia illucens]|uniref:Tudor domain-containing protein 1 n=2 Tax=Hermetia illucens TaxID=343691 RepID=A0A7R8V4T6_HERIL|nr:unnamed protein product [Hermetia illucens]
MAFASKRQNLDLFYNMFKTEYETSIRNVEMCKETADHIYDHVQRQWDSTRNIETCLVNYDKALTDLSHLADKLRKFNIQLELESLQKIKEPKEERFTFPEPQLLNSDVGYESEGVVTYIKDAKNKLFYITETGEKTHSHQIISMQTYFNDNPREFEELPKDGEVFGLHLEGYMFRAVKENGDSDKFSNFSAYLIDVGEIVTINECMPMYVLPEDYQKMPAQAVLCKLEQVNNSHDTNLSEYLGKSLYVKHKFRIVDRDRNMLFVNLYGDTNPFRNKMMGNKGSAVTNEKPVPQITNPFKRIGNQVLENEGNLIAKTANNGPIHGFDFNRNNEIEQVNFNSNDFDTSYMSKVLNEVFKNRNNINGRDYNNANGVNTTTEEQRRILYEEPLNTSNAMKAVMGYEPKDDRRICRFTNPGTNSCFKGAKCKLEHVEKMRDGWTRDEASTIIDIPSQFIYPKIGEHIKIIPTHVLNVENFFAQVVQNQASYEPTLKEMIYKMNSPDIVQSYKVLKSMPVLFSLVIAKYTDGYWYRAKVLNLMDDETVKVFYVDYGNSYVVGIDDIRVWDRRFEYLPFQAIRCKIVGIAEKRNRSLEAAEQLRKMILNIGIKALVVNNIEHLDLRLWGICNNDIAEELISMKLVDRKETSFIRSNQLLPA